MKKFSSRPKRFEFWANDEEFYNVAAKTPRSNCVLDVSKLLATGVKIRPVEEALEDSLQKLETGMRIYDLRFTLYDLAVEGAHCLSNCCVIVNRQS